jgi:hypothetical protein
MNQKICENLLFDNLQDHGDFEVFNQIRNENNDLRDFVKDLLILIDNFQSCEYDKEGNILMVTVTPDEGVCEQVVVDAEKIRKIRKLLQ